MNTTATQTKSATRAATDAVDDAIESCMSNRLPGGGLKADKMPGHWLLARLGKRVLRPGGRAMTQALLENLSIGRSDHVVELAPGLGLTAALILSKHPSSYIGIERDRDAAAWTSGRLPTAANVTVRVGSAEDTGLPSESASLVIGEAMLSMAPSDHKRRIMEEAFRVLKPGGCYAIHELSLVPDDIAAPVKQDIEAALAAAIHVGARPMTTAEWCAFLREAGFTIEKVAHAPMALLQPARIIADEGLFRALRFAWNVLTSPDARRRVFLMRGTFHRHRAHLGAISIVARK
ncbi:methyltransferase domain-containing protein [Xanthobacteraceae bacterium Astr-EGSB]|uniref:class I SAM-dependent methyltransferase n=1 Tax=Astrobacterium formosum TaxID=3069710 RepID=UPI0027AF7AD7|nr:methyltransferase domain-containing protein [Xanthobacteraceae bacterium Astr-EGSB]